MRSQRQDPSEGEEKKHPLTNGRRMSSEILDIPTAVAALCATMVPDCAKASDGDGRVGCFEPPSHTTETPYISRH